MGNVQTCNPPPTSYEAKGKDNNTKAYRWWGLHVLTAKCKDSSGIVYFDKELNIFGIIVMTLMLLIVLWMIMKIMHRKHDDMMPGLQ
jgi:hypothetical protein